MKMYAVLFVITRSQASSGMVLKLDEDGKEPGMHTFNHMHMRKAFRIMNDLRRLVHAVKLGYVMFRVVKMCGVAALEKSFSSVCVRRGKSH